MAVITIIGSGMMGSALAFPARENGHEVRLVGTHLDKDIIAACKETDTHPKFDRPFPAGVKYYFSEEADEAIAGCDFVICGVSSFGVEWFAENMLPRLPEEVPCAFRHQGTVRSCGRLFHDLPRLLEKGNEK